MTTTEAELHAQGTPTQKTTITMVFQFNESSSEVDPNTVEVVAVKRRN